MLRCLSLLRAALFSTNLFNIFTVITGNFKLNCEIMCLDLKLFNYLMHFFYRRRLDVCARIRHRQSLIPLP